MNRLKLNHLLFLIFGAFATLVLVLLVNSLGNRERANDLAKAIDQKFRSYRLANELRQSSDDLTRMARTYAVTGDPKYEKFFERIRAIREGTGPRPQNYDEMYWDLVTTEEEPSLSAADLPASLESRMLQEGFTVEEFALLERAKDKSEELVRLEHMAIHAMRGEFDDGTGTFSVKKAPNQALAIEILHNQKFHEAKAQVMEPIRQFIQQVEYRTGARIHELEQEMTRRLQFGLTTVALLLGLYIYVFGLILRLVLRPVRALEAGVDRLGQGKYQPVQHAGGVRELNKLTETFNHMGMKLQLREEERAHVLHNLELKSSALEREKIKAEELLLNVLPATIAGRLQKGEKVEAETFSEVTVLFADVVGFTKLSTQFGPRSVAGLLNDLFDLLDGLAEKHRLEKIKTIGDCYMAVAGLPLRSPTHTQQMADFALEALDALRGENRRLSQELEIRVGMHSGTVAAGIIGRKKFAYDLWGDVVNVTSRLESTAAPMKIHVSESVKARLEEGYVFEERGEVELKHRGKLKTFYLVGKKREI